MRYIIIFLAFTACCQIQDENTFNVDEPLKPFYYSFMQRAARANVKFCRSDENLSVGVGKLDYPHQGMTYYDRKSIVINEILIRSNLGHSYNTHVDSMEVQYTVYHELAHYFLGREHLPDSTYTIMTPRSSYLLRYMHNQCDEAALNVELFKN